MYGRVNSMRRPEASADSLAAAAVDVAQAFLSASHLWARLALEATHLPAAPIDCLDILPWC
eukprot:304362-Pyramimonas_sp.AAC.1